MRRRRMLVLVFAILGSILASAPAGAACRWVWDCTQQPCRQIELCESPSDPPSIRPTEVPPTPPTAVAPITPPSAQAGTSKCRNANLCNAAGQCKWETVCR